MKKDPNQKTELLRAALKVFKNTTGLDVLVKFPDNADDQPDALVSLVAPGVDQRFDVAIITKLNQAALGMGVHHLQRFPQKGLIVTDYVNPKMAERLKAMNISFLDVAGNAYLNEHSVYVYIKGNKPIAKIHNKPPTRAFQPTGLKVLFALLCYSAMDNASYRDIAKAANVALGTVGWVINDLKSLGYLVDMGKRGRRLTNKETLVTRWVTAYSELLRPKLVLGRYKTVDNDWWNQTRITSFQAYWSGEVAAAKLTKYLIPEQVTIYTQGKPWELLLTNKLKKDLHGNVEILQTFWQTDYDWPHPALVPPLLIYADLLGTGDERNIETARMIYEQELVELVWKD